MIATTISRYAAILVKIMEVVINWVPSFGYVSGSDTFFEGNINNDTYFTIYIIVILYEGNINNNIYFIIYVIWYTDKFLMKEIPSIQCFFWHFMQ